MVTSYTEHYTARNLARDRWGKYMLSRIDDNMIEINDSKYEPVIAKEIWLYGNEANGNILARVFDEIDDCNKYELLTPSTFKHVLLRDISKEVYDNKYRITRDTDDHAGVITLSIINEKDGSLVLRPYNWRNITDINGNLAIIEVRNGVFVLYDMKNHTDIIGHRYDIWAQGDFSVDAPCTRLTKYRETAEHEEGKVTDPMHLSTQSLNL